MSQTAGDGTAPRNTWQEFHDLEAPIYDDFDYTRNTVYEVEFLIEELGLSAGASILDVGCGTGRHAIELARRGYDVTGIDFSEGMLARAKEKARTAGVQVTWMHADATQEPFAREFDAAVCLCEGAFGLLGSTDDPFGQPLAILRNVHRALKPGGKCLFTVLNGCAAIRRHSQEDVDEDRFDVLTLVKVFDFPPREGLAPIRIRERSFAPTELTLLFRLAGLPVSHMWGGTAGAWNRKKLNLDEIEIMVVAEKRDERDTLLMD